MSHPVDEPGDRRQENGMQQQQRNQPEWENPQNWSGPRWLGVYSGRNDTLTWVPKRIPGMGWTVNVGRPAGVFWLVGTIVGIPLLMVLVTVLAGS
jgi:uncharacterized membrane protein